MSMNVLRSVGLDGTERRSGRVAMMFKFISFSKKRKDELNNTCIASWLEFSIIFANKLETSSRDLIVNEICQ